MRSQPVEKLTAGLAAGDPGSVEAFYRERFGWLYAQARRITRRDEAFCLDVVQEAVLRVLRSVRRVRSEGQFRAWLRLVVKTAAYDIMRAEDRRRRRERAAAKPESHHGRAGELEDRDQMEWLRRQIELMDPEVVRLIDLRFQRGWTLQRIAASLGLSLGTVDGRLRRALGKLRDLAQEQSDE